MAQYEPYNNPIKTMLGLISQQDYLLILWNKTNAYKIYHLSRIIFSSWQFDEAFVERKIMTD